MDARELLIAPFAYMPPPRIIEGLTGPAASTRIAANSHSIVEILAHLVFWQSWFLDRASGTATPMVSAAADGWPAATADDWDGLHTRFIDGLEQAVGLASDPERRARPLTPAIEFPPLATYTVGDAMTHLAMHNAHHLGQVITLRQLTGAWPPPQGSWTW